DGSRDRNEICMTAEVGEATAELRKFLFERVYYNPQAKKEEGKAMELVERLFDYFLRYPKKMPQFYADNMQNEPPERCVCDYIAGMTDRYAIELYKQLFVPQVWETPRDML
ncbi:MAG: deoxyguanosinetriphosphate triphosphohydrolase, partial [Clostridia bacterium]|nr:deoxyguanosinetriphosphate triphosphohydrolase [Clostridia bacterium]